MATRAIAAAVAIATAAVAVATIAAAIAHIATAAATLLAIPGRNDHLVAIRFRVGRRHVQRLPSFLVPGRAARGVTRISNLAKTGHWPHRHAGGRNNQSHESAVRSGKRSNSHDIPPECIPTTI
jgi:hypothetical protein